MTPQHDTPQPPIALSVDSNSELMEPRPHCHPEPKAKDLREAANPEHLSGRPLRGDSSAYGPQNCEACLALTNMAIQTRPLHSTRRKLRSRGGFSLSEMLVCIMLLAIAGAAITQALSLGIAQFQERTIDSEAITLGNSIAVETRNQLAFATSFDGGENSTFVSTANTLRNVPCTIVSVDESGDPVADGQYGYVALHYEVEQSNGKIEEFNYFPVSMAEYDKGDIKLAARVDYEYDSGSDAFNVKVTVRDTTSRISDRTQEFAVTPIAQLT